jgi:hypothetical protein
VRAAARSEALTTTLGTGVHGLLVQRKVGAVGHEGVSEKILWLARTESSAPRWRFVNVWIRNHRSLAFSFMRQRGCLCGLDHVPRESSVIGNSAGVREKMDALVRKATHHS